MTSGMISVDEVTRHNICMPNICRWFDGSPNLLLLSQHSALGLQTLLQLVSLNDIKNDWRWGGYHTWSNTVSPPQIYVTHPLRWFTLAMTHHKPPTHGRTPSVSLTLTVDWMGVHLAHPPNGLARWQCFWRSFATPKSCFTHFSSLSIWI